jgi:hypothetical protein
MAREHQYILHNGAAYRSGERFLWAACPAPLEHREQLITQYCIGLARRNGPRDSNAGRRRARPFNVSPLGAWESSMTSCRPFIVAAVLLVRLVVLGCDDTSTSPPTSTVRPYSDVAELESRGVPSGDFSMTAFAVQRDGLIRFTYYTNGTKDAHGLIEPAVAEARQLTATLRQSHAVELVFIDGNPNMTVNDQPTGTGKVLRTVRFEKGT